MVLHERSGRTYHLNASATLMLHALLHGAGHSEVAATVADRFGIRESRASEDIAALLARLRTQGLVD